MTIDSEKVYCIFHSVDNDGFCSGAIVKKKYPHAYLIPFMYTPDMEHLNKIPDGATVFIVDASLPNHIMSPLMDRCNVFWFDHHDTALEHAAKDPKVILCQGIRECELNGTGRAACELTWAGLFPELPLPPAVAMLGRFDAWDQRYFPEALIFDMWVKSKNVRLNDSSMPVWEEIMKMTEQQVKVAIESYRPVYAYEQKMMEISAKSICYEATVAGYKAIVANRSQIGSLRVS